LSYASITATVKIPQKTRKVGYIQPLLVGLQSIDDVSLIMTHAKSLRRRYARICSICW